MKNKIYISLFTMLFLATSLLAQHTLKFEVIEDAIGTANANADTNYPSETTLIIKTHTDGSTNNSTRKGFIKYDIDQDLGNFVSAEIEVYATVVNLGPLAFSFFSISNNWEESTITWNNSPVLGDSLGSVFFSSINTWYSLDITNYLQTAGGMGIHSFGVYDSLTPPQNTHIRFSSREGTNPSRIVITYDSTIWSGTTNTDWATASNWSNGVPTSDLMAHIPSGPVNQPVLTNAAMSVRGLELDAGATITLSTGASLTSLSSTILEGTVTIDSESSLNMHGAYTGSGTVDYTRNLSFSDGRYSVVGSPIAGGTSSSLGTFVYSYDETVAYGANDGLNRFVAVTPGTSMPAGKGYFTAGTSTMSFSGVPNHGDISVGLTYTTGAEAGFNLVANPYPTAIDMSKFLRVNADSTTATAYIWDDNGSNTARGANSDYFTVNNLGSVVGGSNAGRDTNWDGSLRVGQGFFVQANDVSTPTAIFADSMKVSGSNTDAGFFRKAENKPATIKLTLSNGDGFYTQTLVGLVEGATDGDDKGLDAKKLGQSNMQIYTLNQSQKYAIQALAKDARSVELGLLTAPEAGEYTISFETGIEGAFLLDTYTNLRTPIKDGEALTLSLKGNLEDRFRIEFVSVIPSNFLSSAVEGIVVNEGSIKVLGAKYPLDVKISTLSGEVISKHMLTSEQDGILAQDYLDRLIVVKHEGGSAKFLITK